MSSHGTYTATPRDIEHKWFVVDADGMVLGRLAAEIAKIQDGAILISESDPAG